MSPSPYVRRSTLRVDEHLASFVDDEALAGTGLVPDRFWDDLASLFNDLAPRNEHLLAERRRMQAALDAWHQEHPVFGAAAYRAFLEDLGYLVAEGEPFSIDTADVDREIAELAGPQLVVPASNARYALNAANARWGSLYDALYGTDALGSPKPAGPYDPRRGRRVIEWARQFLDVTVPLASGSHRDAISYAVVAGAVVVRTAAGQIGLADPSCFVGYLGRAQQPDSLVFDHRGLGIEIEFDDTDQVGHDDPAHIADVRLEAALTTIVDMEDSVAAVDGADKTHVYRNWLGLMTGSLYAQVGVDTLGEPINRALASDRRLMSGDGKPVIRRGRALMMVRNVGHLMTTPAVLDASGNEVPEGLLDAVMTVLCAMHDLRRSEGDEFRNSLTGSVYVVKPKMHGPAEVEFAVDTMARVEEMLGLAPNTVKLGIMDEERRTTLNLKECIRPARHRCVFINTGFLDRTGDEIRTSTHGGPMVRKQDMRSQRWFAAYEEWNVDIGLECGFRGRAQIGKGMWTAPDRMGAMAREKIAHPMAGASCAWVPSPTAAVLHATHYHQVDVAARQIELARGVRAGRRRSSLDDLLVIPLASSTAAWTPEEIEEELDNNCQAILGYVVRWINHGVGCSKVPDVHDVAQMEDRATCRISSQHVANWLLHGVVNESQVRRAFRRMAAVVDRQNEGDPSYEGMSPRFDGLAFRAACQLVFAGIEQPSGYTEPILHTHRLDKKGRG